ncbi:hypothetical protein EJ065_1852 [Corallococcus coralloides]|uniref:ApeA N-terminal domain-containing protein n=2 Tax=Corallococcus coralloides TaxID=184914 RepID=A0A410RND7_CORCK|nr:hypothetical protein EJ065_1852 [Corallococcus coralloides]
MEQGRDRKSDVPVFKEWILPEMTIRGGGAPWTSRGQVRVFADSRVEIRFTYVHPVRHSQDVPHRVRIAGKTRDGFRLEEVDAVLVGIQPVTRRKTDVVFIPYRCVLSRESQAPIRLARYYLKNLSVYAGVAKVEDGRYRASLSPRGAYEPFRFGAYLDVTGGRLARAKADELAEDVARLVTVASRCPVVPCFREYHSSSRIQRYEFFSNSWDFKPMRNVIALVGDEMGEFLSKTLGNYRAAKAPWRASLLVEYFWRAHQETTAELQFLLLSVFMESVKFNFARNVAKHATKKNSNGTIRDFFSASNVKLGFRDLLIEAGNHLGVPKVDKRMGFIANRNCIFHSGQSSYSQLGQRNTYLPLKGELRRLYDLADDFMLHLLGYKGPFHAYGDPERLRMYPSRRRQRRRRVPGIPLMPSGV